MEDPTHFDAPQRLHPLTLVYRFMVSLPGFVFLLLPVLRGGQSGGMQAWFSLVISIVFGALTIPWIFLYYYRFTFRITPKEVTIHSGIFTRQRRSIPIERIQNVEIEQRLLQRAFGIAKVRISTAGSGRAEGVLESVALDVGRQVRQVIRQYQRTREADRSEPAPSDRLKAPAEMHQEAERVLFSMAPRDVLLAGMFRFSLLYIALIFSGLQYLDIQPEDIVDWFDRGELSRIQSENPMPTWVWVSLGIGMATLLAWLSNIGLTFNRYFGFRLWDEGGKIHKRHGLFTLAEDTIPVKRIQVLLMRANPVMRYFKRYALELQTMGVETKQQGRKVAAPLAQQAAALSVANALYPFTFPDAFNTVSPLTIRRAFIRYTVGLGLLVGIGIWFRPVWTWLWALTLIPLLFVLAYLRYRNHGFALVEDVLFVQRGVWQHIYWVIPLEKIQVLSVSASLFQRRLGLKTLRIDTAGASSWHEPLIVDLPADEADTWLTILYEQFQKRLTRTAHSAPPPRSFEEHSDGNGSL